ncbi:MAG: T9SS type A sorting domain-containing protein [Thermaurantimonas sp.]
MKKILLLFITAPLIHFGQITISGNGNSGFGDPVGSGSLEISTSGSNISFKITRGSGNFNDYLVIYIANGNTGRRAIDGELSDNNDSHRRAISLRGTAGVTFSGGFMATHAIALNAGSLSFCGLWSIPATGTVGDGGLVYINGVSGPGSNTFSNFTFTITYANIGLSAGDPFSVVCIYGNPNSSDEMFLSNEMIGTGYTGSNPGKTMITLDNYRIFPDNHIGGKAATTAAGNWSNASTWANGNVPLNLDEITLSHNTTLDQNASVRSLTINSGATFTASDASPRTLTIRRDQSGSGTTLSNSGTWSNGTGGSTVIFTGSPSGSDAIHSVSGTINFNNVIIRKESGTPNVGVNFGANGRLASGGKLTIEAGGYASSIPSDFYTASSNTTLQFNTTGGYTVNTGDNTWPATNPPSNIQISTNTVILNATRSLTGNLTLDGGNLTINSGNTLTVNGDITANSSSLLTANGTLNINGDGTFAGDLTIGSSGTCTVASGKKLSVGDTLTNGNTLTLQATSLTSYSSLKFGTYSGTGTVTQQRYLRSGTGSAGWNALSTSLNATTASHFGTVGTDVHPNTKNLYRWDGSDWVNITNGSSSISPAVGYYGFVGTNGIRTTSDVYNFTGTPNTLSITPPILTFDNPASGVTFTISGSSSNQGWNLLGNPFTCPLDFSTFTRTNVDNAFYIYTGTSYHSYSGGGLPASLIPPMQAFWVKANAVAPSLGTAWTMALNGSLHSLPDQHRGTSIDDFFVLEVEDANDSEKNDRLTISIVQSATDDFDNEWDAWKMRNNTGYPNIYTRTGANAMAINAVPYAGGQKSFDVSFLSTLHNHPYSIFLRDQYLTNAYAVYLEDKKMNVTHDFKNGAYAFVNDTLHKDRFILKFAAIDPLSTPESVLPVASPYQAWVHDGQIYLRGFEDLGKVSLRVIDVTGKVIKSWHTELHTGSSTTFSLPSIAHGMYILSIEAGNTSRNIKFIH